MKTQKKPNQGRFAKGTSGNAAGRPPGSRNQSTLMMEALLQGEAEQLIRKAVELAKEGDTQALRLCLDRLMPPGRDRLVSLDFPEIHGLEDIPKGMMSIMAAITSGKVAPSEGELLCRILLDFAGALTAQDVEQRLQKLEQRQPSQEGDLTVAVN